MAPEPVNDRTSLVLPSTVVSQVDIIRTARELEALGDIIAQQKNGHGTKALPAVSDHLSELLQANRVDLQKEADRKRLYNFLSDLKVNAPRLHMSFASEPSGIFTNKLITWLRKEIHPLLVLDIGLQPTIAAGCIIRTTNNIIDCSIRQRLVTSKPELLKRIREVRHA